MSYRQIGVVHGAVSECGDNNFPAIFARLDDPQILFFIQGVVKFGLPGNNQCDHIGRLIGLWATF